MKQSLEEVFEIWWEKLKNLRHKFCRETHLIGYDQEDLEQECYFIFRETWAHYDESLGVPFESYYRIRLYGWRANMNRKIKRMQVTLLEDDAEYVDENVSVEKETIQKMLCESGLHQLSEMEYELIYNYYFKGESLKAIAEELNLKYKSVENKKRSVLEKLRELV